MAPLQKRAWWGLGVGLAFGIALLLVFVIKGEVATFNEDLSYRIPVYVLWIGGTVLYLIIMNVTLRRRNQVDERDRLILDKAMGVQLWALIIVLAAWTIGLTVYYNATGQVPLEFLFIIMLSVLVISTVAQSLGILVGYWRMNR